MKRLPQWVVVVLALVLLVGLATPALADEVRGRIVSVDPDKNQFVLQDNKGNELTLHVSKDTRICVDEEDMGLTDLTPDDEVTVTYYRFFFPLIATEIRCRRL